MAGLSERERRLPYYVQLSLRRARGESTISNADIDQAYQDEQDAAKAALDARREQVIAANEKFRAELEQRRQAAEARARQLFAERHPELFRKTSATELSRSAQLIAAKRRGEPISEDEIREAEQREMHDHNTAQPAGKEHDK